MENLIIKMLSFKFTKWTDSLHLVLAIGTPEDVDRSHRQNAVQFSKLSNKNQFMMLTGNAFWKRNVLWGHEKDPDFLFWATRN